jgi:hypothetical protein
MLLVDLRPEEFGSFLPFSSHHNPVVAAKEKWLG